MKSIPSLTVATAFLVTFAIMNIAEGFVASRHQTTCVHSSRTSFHPTLNEQERSRAPKIRLAFSYEEKEEKNPLKHRRTNKFKSTQRQMVSLSLVDNLIQSTSIIITVPADNNVQAEIFADLAHIFLDLATFFTPDTIILRLFVVIGRMFSILSDYIPDQKMTPEEFLFQSSMLWVSSRNFLEKFHVVLRSTLKTSTFSDRRVYHTTFRPAGFTWMQYMALMNDALEWNEAPDGSIFFEDKSDLLVMTRGLVYTRNHMNDDVESYGKLGGSHCGIIGDLSLLSRLVDSDDEKPNIDFDISGAHSIFTNDNQAATEDHDYNFRMFQAWGTGTGASILRINTERLFDAAKKDPRIAECTKNLYYNAMREKLFHYECDSRATLEKKSDPISV